MSEGLSEKFVEKSGVYRRKTVSSKKKTVGIGSWYIG